MVLSFKNGNMIFCCYVKNIYFVIFCKALRESVNQILCMIMPLHGWLKKNNNTKTKVTKHDIYGTQKGNILHVLWDISNMIPLLFYKSNSCSIARLDQLIVFKH